MSRYKKDILAVTNLDLPWERFNGSNILVTGATGLIGSVLVDTLLTNKEINCNVYASGRNEERACKLFAKYSNNPNYHFIKHDVNRPLASNVLFDYIVHCASGASPSEYANTPVEVMKSNFMGVSHLLDYGREHGMKRFLYVSSGEVYGEGDGRMFTEEYSGYVDCMSPRSCYPSAKRAAETLCASYVAEYGMDVVVARPCHIYGPRFTESDNRVYAQFIRNVLRDEDIVMKSTGEQFRSWCYVVDCVSALLHILLKGENGQAYNIADETSDISVRELAEMIADICGKKVITEIPSEREKVGYNTVTRSIFSTKKLCGLGWDVKGKMKDKIETTIIERKDEIQKTYFRRKKGTST